MNAYRRLQSATPEPAPEVPAFCETCALLQAGPAVDNICPECGRPVPIVANLGPYRAGDCLYQRGEPFDALFVVRSGTVKIRRSTLDGRERIGAFYLPGDAVGLRAVHPGRYAYDAVALDTTYVCRYPFPAVCGIASRRAEVQQHLLRLLGRELRASQCLAAAHSAEARMAAFLVRLGERYARCGQSATAYRLRMTRADIGSYLRLANETVTRILARFQRRRWIRLHAHHVELLTPSDLRAAGRELLTY